MSSANWLIHTLMELRIGTAFPSSQQFVAGNRPSCETVGEDARWKSGKFPYLLIPFPGLDRGPVTLTSRIRRKLSESGPYYSSLMPQQKPTEVRVVTPLKISESPSYPGYFLISLTRNVTLVLTANELFALHAIIAQSLNPTPKS